MLTLWAALRRRRLGQRRQERVNARHHDVKGSHRAVRLSFTGAVIENIIAAVAGIALLVYLVYALVRPERF